MTAPAPETIEREKEKLYVTDAELIRRLGVPEKIGRAMLHVYDREKNRGFPQKQAVMGNRRYWPAVKAFLDRTNGLTVPSSSSRRSIHD
jgi:hypothetical protein